MVQKVRDRNKELHHKSSNAQFYYQWLQDELEEIQAEMKPNNAVYLEDELGDILRDYMNMLYLLQQEWLITDWKKVFERSQNKYHERVADQLDGKLRKETKARQKQVLADEHKEKYGHGLANKM